MPAYFQFDLILTTFLRNHRNTPPIVLTCEALEIAPTTLHAQNFE
jgi:hypothetical protein